MATILSDIKTPLVNDATLKRVASPKIKENIFQQIFTRPGEAVTEQFSNDTMASQIQIIRIKPNNKEAREIGSDKNGGWFNNSDASTSTTQAYGIDILDMIDDNIDVPADEQDMMSVDLVEAELQNLTGRVAKNVNAITFAVQLAKNFNDVKSGVVEDNKVTVSGSDYLSAIIDAGAKLDDGNEAEGIDAYPDDWRAVFIRSKAKAELLKKGQIVIGGSNDAQSIIRKGGLDSDTTPSVASTGYMGEVDNMPIYMASKSTWRKAEQYMGLESGALDKVEMLVVSGYGTGRALAFNSAIKITDCPSGQGRRIQPKYRFGASCWDALSVVPIVSEGFVAPTNTITVKAPGSR